MRNNQIILPVDNKKNMYIISEIIAYLVIILTVFFPLIINYKIIPNNMKITYNVTLSTDYFTYLSKINEGIFHWLYYNNYNSLSSKGVLAFTQYILLGKICKITHIEPITAYYLYALLGLIALIAITQKIIVNMYGRKDNLLLIVSLLMILPNYILNLIIPEMFPSTIVLVAPHVTWIMAFLGYLILLINNNNWETRNIIKMTITELLIVIIHPYDSLPLFFITAYYLYNNRNKIYKKDILLLSIPYLYTLFLYIQYFSNPQIENWLKRGITQNNYIYQLPYYIIWIVAIIIAYKNKQTNNIQNVIYLWLLIALATNQLPLNFNRRYIELASLFITLEITVNLFIYLGKRNEIKKEK